jgi:preprotein translocase subunit YajC
MHFLAQAATPGGSGPGFVLTILPYLLFFVLFYYLFVAMPMKKKQKAFDDMMKSLKNGDRVVTSGGMYGVVTGITDKTLKIRIANNVVVDMDKTAIAGLAEEPKEDKKEK